MNLTASDEALAAQRRLSDVEQRMANLQGGMQGGMLDWLGLGRREGRQEVRMSPPPQPPPPRSDARQLPPPPPPPPPPETEFAVSRSEPGMASPGGDEAPMLDLAAGFVVTIGIALASQAKLPTPGWLRALGIFVWDEASATWQHHGIPTRCSCCSLPRLCSLLRVAQARIPPLPQVVPFATTLRVSVEMAEVA